MKKLIIISIVLVFITVFTACKTSTTPSKDKVSEPPKTTTEIPKDSNGNTDKQTEKPVDDKTPNNTPQAIAIPTKATDISAVYVGQIDGNSIEVRINGVEAALFFSNSVKDTFDSSLFKKDSKVQVTYSKNDKGQYILTNIKNKS